MIACWQGANDANMPLPDTIDQIPAWVPDGPAPARCAIELALFDRLAKRRNVPLHQLLDLPRPGDLSTTFTISIDTPDAMAAMAKQIANYPLIKLKLGSDDDESRVRAVRQARPDAKLCVDANAGWTLDAAIAHLKWLEKYDIELIEQRSRAISMKISAKCSSAPPSHRRRRIGANPGGHRAPRPRRRPRDQPQADESGRPHARLANRPPGARAEHENHAWLHDRNEHRHHRRRPSRRAGRLARPRRAAADHE
jgi:hypothetical protein